MSRSGTEQFVLLPRRGAALNLPMTGHGRIGPVTTTAHVPPRGHRRYEIPAVDLTVLDSIRTDGPKLVSVDAQLASTLTAYDSLFTVVPVVYYTPATVSWPTPLAAPTTPSITPGSLCSVQIISGSGGTPIANAMVVAFSDFAHRLGEQGQTDGTGHVTFSGKMHDIPIERLYVLPSRDYWDTVRMGVRLAPDIVVELKPIDFNVVDALQYFHRASPHSAGKHVRVGVIDTGVAAHPDLLLEGGMNAVTGEDPADYGSNGMAHGTHVAGIIAGQGSPPQGLHGVAPGVSLRSYRVFGQNTGQASNFAVAKAIDAAVNDECDLLNLSLGGRSVDLVIQQAIEDARNAGCLVMAAVGNDSRAPVGYPAADPLAVGVAAMGRRGTFPLDASANDCVAAPFGTDQTNFVAAFSNCGAGVDLIGPGVAIVSTVPGGYAVMDGTSMACPAMTGAGARLLAEDDRIRSMPRDRKRADAIADLLLHAAKPLGFGANFEGHGMIA